MKEYHLNQINETARGISIVLILPLFFGGIAIVYAWNFPFWGKLGLILTVSSLLGMIICYFKTYEKFILKIDSDTLTISKKKNNKKRKIKVQDIALIQYNKSMDALSGLMTRKPPMERIAIISKTGKTIFVCSNNCDLIEFRGFFNDIRGLMHAKELFIYAKQIRMTSLYRSLYINPLYENTSLVKKKTRQAGFYYWMIIIVVSFIILITALNLFNIYRYGS